MKLLRYGQAGSEKPGLLDDDGSVRDLSDIIDDVAGSALSPDSLEKIAALDISALPLVDGVAQKDLRLGACVGQIGKFICIGLNYADHAAESGLDVPPEPVSFLRWFS